MKKIVTMMLVMLVSVTALAGKTKDPYHFVVEGEFLADKNIHCTIFEQDKSGNFVALEHTKARKYFHVECNVGHKYIVRFQNKKGDVKFLMIDASTNGYFQTDVDWKRPFDGLIKKEKIGYCLTVLTNGNRPVLLAQK